MLSSAATAASTAPQACAEKSSLQLLGKKYQSKRDNQDNNNKQPQINSNEPSYYIKSSVMSYEFKYRKSIFATVFAICILVSVLFIILYLQCFASYMKVAHEKSKNIST